MRDVRPATNALVVAALLLVATRQTFTVRFTGLGLTPAQLILLVLVVFWLVTRMVGQRAPAGLGLLSGLSVVLVAVTLVSYSLCQGNGLTADQRTGSDRTVLLLSLAVGSVVVLSTVLRTRRDIELVLRALIIGGALSGLFAVVQFGVGIDVASYLHIPGLADTGGAPETLLRGGLERPSGSAAAPLELGGVLTMLIPVGLGVAFAAGRRGERAWPWGLAVAVMAAGGAVSLSRSVFLGVAVALVVMAPRWPVRRAIAVIVGAVLAAAVTAVFASSLVSAITTLLLQGSDDYSLSSRADGRSYVWNHFADHFWFGQGPGTYDLTRQNVLDNQYLSQLMEGGVLGALALAAVLVCALGYAIRAARPGPSADVAELANGLAGALAGALVVNSVLDTSGFVQVFTLIWLLIAMSGAVWRLATCGADSIPSGVKARAAQPAGVAAH